MTTPLTTAEIVERVTARAKSEQEGGDEAAADRAMMGMEAQSDLWAERVNLNDLIENIVNVGRLRPDTPHDVRESFIKRQRELIDALMRQAFLEGFLEGGLSRKAYDVDLDESVASALLALEGERDEARADVKVLNKELYLVRNTRDNNADAVRYYETKFEAAEAELAKVREERDAFFDKLRQLLCINSVLTALKADAPLWLEHAEKLIDDHNAALAEKAV